MSLRIVLRTLSRIKCFVFPRWLNINNGIDQMPSTNLLDSKRMLCLEACECTNQWIQSPNNNALMRSTQNNSIDWLSSSSSCDQIDCSWDQSSFVDYQHLSSRWFVDQLIVSHNLIPSCFTNLLHYYNHDFKSSSNSISTINDWPRWASNCIRWGSCMPNDNDRSKSALFNERTWLTTSNPTRQLLIQNPPPCFVPSKLCFPPTIVSYCRDLSMEEHRRRTQRAKRRFFSKLDRVIEKYEKDYDETGDVIDLVTRQLIIDNDHLRNIAHEQDIGLVTNSSSKHNDNSPVRTFHAFYRHSRIELIFLSSIEPSFAEQAGLSIFTNGRKHAMSQTPSRIKTASKLTRAIFVSKFNFPVSFEAKICPIQGWPST